MMLKFKGTFQGKTLFTKFSRERNGFGLTRENLERLRQDQPILIDFAEMGGDGGVLIFYGKDEKVLAEMVTRGGVEGMVTKLHFDTQGAGEA